MKSRFLNWFGRGGSSVERELEASRPQPPETLVRAISAKIQQRPARSRVRVGFALGLSAAMLAAIGASGGLGYASSSIRDASSSITKLVHATHLSATSSGKPPKPPKKKPATHITAACTQYSQAPTFTSMTPTSAYVGTAMTFHGHHFSGDSALTAITYHGGKVGTGTKIVSDTTATTHVPFGATTGAITLTNCAGSVNTTTFTLTYHVPVITSDGTTPRSGPYKTTVTIRGSHFSGTSSVKFNGKSATFTLQSDKQILAKVPFGAGHGNMTVTNPAGTSNGLSFTETYITPSGITFTPSHGAVGTTVTVHGSHFSGTTSVTFNGKAGTNLSLTSDTALTVKVPTGATTGKIKVINPAGTGTSAATFTVN